jgi:hypothetical protein
MREELRDPIPTKNRDLSMRLITILCLMIVIPLSAKDKKSKTPPPQDAIEVVAHIPLTSGPVRRFLTTDHYSNHYLYAEHDAGANVTLIDVTRPSKPAVLAEVTYPAAPGSDSLVVVSGTAALVTGSEAPQSAAPQTIRILDLSDPQHPKVAREFIGVTAIDRDDRRGLIFLANAEGVWILHQSRAEDPEVEKAYAHHVIYDH